MDRRMIYCEACKDTQGFGKFHNRCGAKLTLIPQCQVCYAQLWPHERFCAGCGTPNRNTNTAEVPCD